MEEAEASGGVSLANPSLFTCDEQVREMLLPIPFPLHLPIPHMSLLDPRPAGSTWIPPVTGPTHALEKENRKGQKKRDGSHQAHKCRASMRAAGTSVAGAEPSVPQITQVHCACSFGGFVLPQVTVGCTTLDVLRHLSSEETARAIKGKSIDRMSRLAIHLLGQRSFYPLFPPALGTCLDTSLAPQALHIPLTPHLLILPSDLAAFAKVWS